MGLFLSPQYSTLDCPQTNMADEFSQFSDDSEEEDECRVCRGPKEDG